MLEIVEFIKDTFKYLIIIGIIVLIRIFVLSTAEVVGESMDPNLISGDYILVEQVSKRLNNINRFDIVAFKHKNPSFLIKRVIGLPEEEVKYLDNNLYINNKLIKENFDFLGEVNNFTIKLDKDEYFVIGDNRDNSKDSRSFGSIKKDVIIGKPILVIWPIKNVRLLKII